MYVSDMSENINIMAKIFPYINDKDRLGKLKIDTESLKYISLKEDANNISMIIMQHLGEIGIEPSDAKITDATAGVGGNTLSFAMNFDHVIAIEIDKMRADYLINNAAVYDLDNITVHADDCNNVLYGINKQDVVFFDPPWGGVDYKKEKKLRLELCNRPIEELCMRLFDEKITKSLPSIIVLKLPTNYDLKYLYDMIDGHTIFLHKLPKMHIIIIQRLYSSESKSS